ncbi:MAG: hypothetical protein ACK41W_09890, partial [Cyanobacteriota bacterium]
MPPPLGRQGPADAAQGHDHVAGHLRGAAVVRQHPLPGRAKMTHTLAREGLDAVRWLSNVRLARGFAGGREAKRRWRVAIDEAGERGEVRVGEFRERQAEAAIDLQIHAHGAEP